MTEQNKNVGLKNSARRKLVRGAFGVPAVLTLHSGGAFAATSAVGCLARTNQFPLTLTPTASDDTYFRYRLWALHKVHPSNEIKSLWIKGSELTVYVRNNQLPFITQSAWAQFNVANNSYTSTGTAPSLGGDYALVQDGPFVALRIDANGNLVGAGATGSGSAVADTCWNSFALRP